MAEVDILQAIIVSHKSILLDPYGAAILFGILKENIELYEKKYGKIEKPDAISIAEKLSKSKKPSVTTPSYLG